jgi:hypothetical protein
MELPITESELELIMQVLKNKEPHIYNKLWSYKFNRNHTQNKE